MCFVLAMPQRERIRGLTCSFDVVPVRLQTQRPSLPVLHLVSTITRHDGTKAVQSFGWYTRMLMPNMVQCFCGIRWRFGRGTTTAATAATAGRTHTVHSRSRRCAAGHQYSTVVVRASGSRHHARIHCGQPGSDTKPAQCTCGLDCGCQAHALDAIVMTNQRGPAWRLNQ